MQGAGHGKALFPLQVGGNVEFLADEVAGLVFLEIDEERAPAADMRQGRIIRPKGLSNFDDEMGAALPVWTDASGWPY